MIFGTAGFTACLALLRMEQNGQTPGQGPILVTGASGGVGQFAVAIFTKAGYEVHALTAKDDARDRLTELGAKKILLPTDLPEKVRPVEGVKYGGAVDSLGGATLEKVLAQTQLWGNVASIGLAENAAFSSTVMPFILRGVSLLGTSSNNCSWQMRLKVWDKLVADFSTDLADFVSQEVELTEVLSVAKAMLERRTRGRILVRI
jgi:NADPH2:quinone reductase